MGNDILSQALLAWGVSAGLMAVLWYYQLIRQNAGVVDLGWAVSIIIAAGVFLCFGEGWPVRRFVFFLLPLVWGCRLSLLLLGRFTREAGEDRRYRTIRKDWEPNVQLKFFLLFQFESFLALLLAVPFAIAAANPAAYFSPLELAGLAVGFAGIACEALSDHQLKWFKSDPANKGKVCQAGLWNYSRHPNYFFEWVVWLGIFLFALGSPHGIWAAVSPAVMLVFLLKITGIPIAEQHAIESRGEAYLEYQRTTSYFLPLPKKPRKEKFMRRIPVLVLMISLALCQSAGASENSAFGKLKRGAINVLTSPVEIIKYTRAYWIEGSEKTDHILVWLFSGAVEGMVEAVKRFGSGLWDVVSFPVAVPKDYKPLQKPEYVFDDWPKR